MKHLDHGPVGHVLFVGAGPGSADLITLRGARALARADVVLHDALTDPALRELAPQACWVDVGKRGFCDSVAQTRINALLVRYAKEHAVVVRLKGGDPSVFGRLEEELEAVRCAGIACEVVPGVTAALAAAAVTQRPLTRRGRGRSVALTTAVVASSKVHSAHGDDPIQSARNADTEVFYMAGRQLPALSRALLDAGWADDTAVSVVSNAGGADAVASSHTVAGLAAAAMLHHGRPTVVCVGVGAEAIQGEASKRVVAAPSQRQGTTLARR